MLITFFPRLWHGICTAFNAEDAEKGGNGGTANSKAVHRRGAEDAEKGGNGGTANSKAVHRRGAEDAEGD